MEDHEFKLAALKTGLKHLFDKGHFNICGFDELCKLANVIPPPDLHKTLHALHCVDYTEMTKGLRDEIFKRIVGVFAGDNQGFDLTVFDESPPKVFDLTDLSEKRSWWKRALGSS